MKTSSTHSALFRAFLYSAFVAGFALRLDAAVPEYDYPTDLTPPPTATFDSTVMVTYAGGLIIDNIDIRLPDTSLAPPAGATTQQYHAIFACGIDLGTGVFQQAVAQASVTVRVTPVDVGIYDTEMLQLDIQGGTLPAGVMIRESPTLASTGRNTILSQADGSYRISSFFDIFTELSVDGGQTWVPGNAAARATAKPLAPENPFPSSVLLPPAGTYLGGSAITFASGVVFRNLVLSNPNQSVPPPPPGGSQIGTAVATLTGEVSLDNGTTFQPLSASASLAYHMQSTIDSGATRHFDTEMLSLDVSGGGLMVRESPTKASLGRTSIRQLTDGTYRIGSFFDIFTELSLDGGATWSPATSGACNFALPAPAPPVPVAEYFYPTDCFPLRGSYEANADVVFANGVVLREVRHRVVAPRQPLPGAGESQTQHWGGTVEFELSRDGGNTFASYSRDVLEDVLVSGFSAGSTDRPMESLSLNFTTGDGVMVRESPTRASLGKTTVRAVTGGFMVGSFFDVFTEVSLDGGQTWTPAGGALHLALLPYIEQTNVFATDFFPPRTGSQETRRYAPPLDFGNGWQIRNLRLASFSKSNSPPALGASRLMEEEGIFYFELSTDGGTTFAPCQAPAVGSADVRDTSESGDTKRSFDTEMLQLNISGGTLPAGAMIRESPTKVSSGRMSIIHIPRIGQEVVVDFLRIDSFFDVFTELSTDGGQTWLPANGAARLELHAQPTEVFAPSDFAPLAVQHRATDYEPTSFGGTSAIRGVVVQGGIEAVVVQGGRQPLPGAGQSTTRNWNGPITLEMSSDGGQTFQQVSTQVTASIHFTHASRMMVGGLFCDRFDTEMLALDLAGGTLPAGTLIRESPTRASLGATTVRAVEGGFMVSSFFDVFTELSTDGGATWTPACEPLHFESDPVLRTSITGTMLLPPAGDYSTPPGGPSLRCATGQHIKEARLERTERGGKLPPGAGKTTSYTETFTADFLYSADDGQTFTRVRAPAMAQVGVLGNALQSGVRSFDTEMLALNISGGTLPAGVMIRESPTLPSRGKTSVQDNSALGGGFRISSFFDVFTEISLDGGGTWQPFDCYLQIELHEVFVTSYSLSSNYPLLGDLMPTDQVSLNFTKVSFADGSVLKGFDVFLPAGTEPLPALGQTLTYNYDAQGRLVRVVDAAGNTESSDAPAQVSVRITHALDDGTTQFFDTEMLALNLSGGTLPAGVMIRESPTLPSVGRMSRQSVVGGRFRISSFFDVFTELSTDGGATWSPSDGPSRLEFVPSPPPVITDQPDPVTVLPGLSAAFHVVATGAPPLSCQWLRNGVVLANQTSVDLSLKSVSVADAGFYSVRVNGPGGMVFSRSAELVVLSFFPAASGRYNALLGAVPPDPAANENSGYVNLTIGASGSFTGKVYLAGTEFVLSGRFTPNGTFHKQIGALVLDLQLSAAGLHLGTMLTSGGAMLTAAGDATKVLYDPRRNPAPQTAAYTALIPAPDDTDLPRGTGYAVIVATNSGSVKIAGRTGDSGTFSYGSYFLDPDGTLPFFAIVRYPPPPPKTDLPKVGGTLSGRLTFRDIPGVSDCDGRLSWDRSQLFDVAPEFGNGSFLTKVDFVGARYTPPPAGTRMIVLSNTPGNAEVQLVGGQMLSPITKVVTVSPTNTVMVVSPGADALSLVLKPATGLFTGTFVHPDSKEKLPINGAVLQKQNLGGGVFFGTDRHNDYGSGSVSLAPR